MESPLRGVFANTNSGLWEELICGRVFVFPLRQPKPPASLAEEEKREEAFVSRDGKRQPDKTKHSGRFQAGSENHIPRFKCGCVLSWSLGPRTAQRKLLMHWRLRSGPSASLAAPTASINTAVLPWTPFSPLELPEAKIKQPKPMLNSGETNLSTEQKPNQTSPHQPTESDEDRGVSFFFSFFFYF